MSLPFHRRRSPKSNAADAAVPAHERTPTLQSPQAENFEVHASPVGMATNPLAPEAIAERRWYCKLTHQMPLQAAARL